MTTRTMASAEAASGHGLTASTQPWLTSDRHVALAGIIEQLAERTSGPRFPPHVTLLSGIPSDTPVEVVRAQAAAALEAWSREQSRALPLELTMDEVDTRSARYFQFVFAHIRPTADLLSLRQACRSAYSSDQAIPTPKDDNDWMPHLSLAYGDRGADEILDDLRRSDRTGAAPAPPSPDRTWSMHGRSFRVNAVEIWACEGPPADWTCAGSMRLGVGPE